MKVLQNNKNVEKLICLIAENQKFAKSKDKLTSVVEKFSGYMSEELSEEELGFVIAAKMPEIPKYKQIKNNL